MPVQDLGPVLKAAYPRVVATLIRVLGDMDRAMDATQDALVKALQVWQVEGVPDNPVAWLVTVGRNRAVDVIRRDNRAVSLDQNVVALVEVESTEEPPAEIDWSEVDDDLLRLMFTCCHPLLTQESQIVLMLKVVLGFSVEEIARGLLASPASIEKRITRAKQKLKNEDVQYEVPRAEEIPERRAQVLKAIYLIFNEGYTRIQDQELARGSLIDVAIQLARMTSRLFRFDPAPRSLLALMLLSAARLPARVGEDGVFVPLEKHDRSLWDQKLIGEGIAVIDAVYAARHPPDAYQIQAAISAIHCQAASVEETDWPQIVALYDKLGEYDPSPVIPVNRAVALCFCDRAVDAMRELSDASVAKQLHDYQPYYAALAFTYERAGLVVEAVEALATAIDLAPSTAQKSYLQKERLRLESLLL